jgi:hypothetical protein
MGVNQRTAKGIPVQCDALMHRFLDVQDCPPEDFVSTRGKVPNVDGYPQRSSIYVTLGRAGIPREVRWSGTVFSLPEAIRPNGSLAATASSAPPDRSRPRTVRPSGQVRPMSGRAPRFANVRPARKKKALSRLGNRAGERRFSAETGAMLERCWNDAGRGVGRGGRIRTDDNEHPKLVHYQAVRLPAETEVS